MGIVPWSPLAGGLLTGKYNDGIPEGSRGATTEFLKNYLNDEYLGKVKQIGEIANELDLTTGQLALAWCLRRDEISSVIMGATKVEHVQNNLRASGVTLSKDVLQRIEEILDNTPEFHPVYTQMLVEKD
ncbi:MAG: aldo/keto reductase, partial [Candidatus Kariarchaeaceae archaeon]|jgi:aryl-alcohol dehydrogenase-like predicted oxidoreductase